MDINNLIDSPFGTRFMISSPPLEIDGREC